MSIEEYENKVKVAELITLFITLVLRDQDSNHLGTVT